MKTFSVAVTVAVVLVFICIQQSSATFPEVQELEEAVSNDNAAAEHQETSVDLWMNVSSCLMSLTQMPYNRQKRGFKCKFCCGCCSPGVCGLCCRF
ncbi:hepcidin-like [Hippoglossus hippoglossus]|uniref:hepcidin-like n=1 Tax=Hippoglossus hippoglossus TaxID=8267 RepID=UPI00148D3086|nr:hepcidin-like [Hippoglossus hippoglossus]